MPISPQIPPARRRIEILAFPQAQLLDVAGPLQVFASANGQLQARLLHLRYDVRVVAGQTPLSTSAGLDLLPAPLSRHGTRIDTLIVSGGRGVHAACQDPPTVRWLARRAQAARRVASVCTGAFLVGTAGLLRGRRAVTHWEDCARLARQFPDTRVETDPIFVRDGRIWTSAGVTAGMDLALALVEEDAGAEVAMAVARELVLFLRRPGGQAQFSATLDLQQRDVAFARLHAWIAARLGQDLSVPVLAARAGMSERSFVRHYRAAVGLSPARAVQRLRIEAARRLLAEGQLPVKRIAQRCGFGSEETLRRTFQRTFGASPRDYRERFGGRRRGQAMPGLRNEVQ